jgi:hypothetical protein
MTEKMLTLISAQFPLKELSCGEFARQKVSGMHFQIRRFHAEGLGSVSEMRAVGFFGLMKMYTLIITPTEKDMPLYSYDRVLAMGNDTLIFELYDTLLGETALSGLEKVKDTYKELPTHDLGKHWYDEIKLSVSLSKKGKKGFGIFAYAEDSHVFRGGVSVGQSGIHSQHHLRQKAAEAGMGVTFRFDGLQQTFAGDGLLCG